LHPPLQVRTEVPGCGRSRISGSLLAAKYNDANRHDG
jgi:hypothetical protein